MKRSMLLLILVLNGLLTASCASTNYQDFRYFKSIGITHDIHAVKNSGMVRSEDCQLNFFGYNVQGPPSFEDALENAVGLSSSSIGEALEESVSTRSRLTQTKVRLMTNLQMREEGWNLGFIGRSCLKLSAVAYQ
ncbi:MAG: hypothetical protein J0L82_16565 [Deltaproteobacteria bacterium]|nr:hypothetical protein [Deltaproteobacteria bacterium]